MPEASVLASGISLVACSRHNERIQFRLRVLAYRCVHGIAPAYLVHSLQLTADAPARRRLGSTDTMAQQVPSTRRSTIGDWAFPVAAARTWNSLPPAKRAANSLLQTAVSARIKSTLSLPPVAPGLTRELLPTVWHLLT